MKIIDAELLDLVTKEAKESPRLRMNHNFHEKLDAKAQRLLNALEPGTQLPIHRHMNTPETYFLVRGSLRVLFYDDNRELTESCELNSMKGKYGVDIPAGQWHTIEVLESGTIIFEVKEGPYAPLEDKDIL
ncbi:MAG TPA: WbuC family cupin fold metalloprotein [Paludibacter sp.]